MLNEILNFVQTNIIHFGYLIAILIFGSVIKSIVKTLKGKEDKSIFSNIKEKIKKDKPSDAPPEPPPTPPIEEPGLTKEQIDNIVPPG